MVWYFSFLKKAKLHNLIGRVLQFVETKCNYISMLLEIQIHIYTVVEVELYKDSFNGP